MDMLINLLGTQGAGFALLAAVFLVIFLAGKWTSTLSSSNKRLDSIETSITTINSSLSSLNGDVCYIKNIIDRQQRDIDGLINLNNDVSYIKNTIDKQQRNIDGLAQHNSPVQLTDKGQRAKEQLKATQLLANHWDKIKNDILTQKKDSSNPYDIQQICFDYFMDIEKVFTKEEVDKIKLVAYERGESITSYYIVFGIETRNKIFEILQINVDDVDIHDPDSN